MRCVPHALPALALAARAACSDLSPPADDPRAPSGYPMKRDEFFGRLDHIPFQSCEDAGEKYNLDRQRCLDIIEERTRRCAATAGVPAMIGSHEEFRTHGGPYLQCATPYVFCNGIEVKSAREIIERCTSSRRR